MSKYRIFLTTLAVLAMVMAPAFQVNAKVFTQVPGDTDGDCIIDTPDPEHPNARGMHLSAGDGFVQMADGQVLYIFSFADITGYSEDEAIMQGMLRANFPAPTIALDEGDELYLNLTNVGMAIRPDLFDPHTVHYHGFTNAAPVFDGVPDSSISINMGSTVTYYYKNVEPGTYMYHCHVEATEHMQMGMLGNLYVRPAQNKLPDGTDLNGFQHHTGYKYCYNDGDGSTYYDIGVPLQLGSFDYEFHIASETVQPLPFALMEDEYTMINGRGYPDTVNPNPLPPLPENGNQVSQPISSLIVATQGQKILLRLSNLNVTRDYTVTVTGIPMKVVGKDHDILRGPSPDGGITPGEDLYYYTSSITTAGGESYDAILETANVEPGTYFMYTTNLNYLCNFKQDFGGMMTQITILAAK